VPNPTITPLSPLNELTSFSSTPLVGGLKRTRGGLV
jgi:hypothetical protein